MSKVSGTSQEATPASEHSSRRARQIKPHTILETRVPDPAQSETLLNRKPVEALTTKTAQLRGACSAVRETVNHPRNGLGSAGPHRRAGTAYATDVPGSRTGHQALKPIGGLQPRVSETLCAECRISCAGAEPGMQLSAKNDVEGRTKDGGRRARALLSWLRRGESCDLLGVLASACHGSTPFDP
jgi:hypothetical protein